MRLAICDDDEREVASLKGQLAEYQRLHQDESLVYLTYSKPAELLAEWDKNRFDIAVLDIVMPGMTGIELAEKFKNEYPDTIIIFLTTSPEFALDAYSLHAERYILKPVVTQKLFEALDYALKIKGRGARSYSIKTSMGVSVVKHEQILYIEMNSRRMIVHLVDGQEIISIYLRGTFTEMVEELLDTGNFILTHKSFLVNMSYVKTYSSTNLILQANNSSKEVMIPVSRQQASSVKQNYLEFMAKGREV
ncbi:MAG: LytTR family DNA-binding domain-containing protein [Lachnospiraceae bacterium]|nr:LytTR family DNA-binding domain-containing protein [Lachnospiraceae bacterium]